MLLYTWCATLVSCFMTARRGQLVRLDHSALAEDLYSLKTVYALFCDVRRSWLRQGAASARVTRQEGVTNRAQDTTGTAPGIQYLRILNTITSHCECI